jgi:hypothetical protein
MTAHSPQTFAQRLTECNPKPYLVHTVYMAHRLQIQNSAIKMRHSHLQLGEFARWADKHQRDRRPISTSGSDLNLKHIPYRPCSTLSCGKFYLKRYSKRATELTRCYSCRLENIEKIPEIRKLFTKTRARDLCPTSL